ncbi:hypothetical protein [Mumia zhuanghuii]|uniref:hypothetical protein n=1 Tax=Mumia zhuanghuii TaxID=2585211 RepID=UPI003640EE2A
MTTAPGRTRVAGAVVVAALSALAVVALSSSGGAEEDRDQSRSRFVVSGDGSLPTERPKLREPREPLSPEESGYAIRVAQGDDSVPASARDVRGESMPEFLYADVPTDVDSSGRKALVVLYDYTADTTYHQTVDLRAGKVVESLSAASLQPPLSAGETETAMRHALEAEGETLRFTREFERSEGVPLLSEEQVSYVAGVWTYDGTTDGGRECGAERCAQLGIRAPSGTYLDTTDFVINLSDRSIVRLH